MNYWTNECDRKQLLQRHPLRNPPLLRTSKFINFKKTSKRSRKTKKVGLLAHTYFGVCLDWGWQWHGSSLEAWQGILGLRIVLSMPSWQGLREENQQQIG